MHYLIILTLSGAWMVVGEEFMRFVNKNEEEGEEVSFVLIEWMKLYGCLVI